MYVHTVCEQTSGKQVRLSNTTKRTKTKKLTVYHIQHYIICTHK